MFGRCENETVNENEFATRIVVRGGSGEVDPLHVRHRGRGGNSLQMQIVGSIAQW